MKRTALSPPLMKGLCCNGWQRVLSTQSTGVIQQPGRGLEVPTTTPHYTWLYTFTERTPVQCLAERWGLQSNFLIPIFAQANGALLIRGWRKWTKETRIPQSKRWVPFLSRISHRTGKKYYLISKAPHPSPSFVEPCIVGDPNLPGASLPQRQVKLVSRMMGNYLLRFGEDSAVSQYPRRFRGGPFYSILLYTLSEKNVF